jgi:NDP-sugar pyrophosphorylase family protein
LLVTWVDDTARYGTVDLDDAGAVIAFREKSGQAIPGWINAGVYLLSRRLLMSIPAGIASLERDVLPSWVGRGLDGYRMKLPFVDIGTPESYARAEALLAQRHR